MLPEQRVFTRTSRAEVAELADAHGSGPCARKGVGVRVPSSAPSFLVASLPNRWRALQERAFSKQHSRPARESVHYTFFVNRPFRLLCLIPTFLFFLPVTCFAQG